MAARASQTRFVRMGEPAAAKAGPRDVVLVPGAEVPVFTLDLPQGLRETAREEVARRQLRDLTGQDAGTLELRPFHATGNVRGWTRALVAEGARVAEWRAAAGPQARAVLPDYLALPAAPGVWAFGQAGDSLLARLGPEDGFAATAQPARLMLKRALEAAPPEAALVPDDAPDWVRGLLADAGVAMATTAEAVAKLGAARPETLGHGELGFDLRSNPLAERARLERRVLPWRWPALAGLVAAALWAATQIVVIRAAETEARGLQEATQARVRAAFVPTGPILDIRSQVSRALAGQRREAEAWRGRTSPLVLFGQAAGVIADQNATTEEVLYGPDEGLIVMLRVADFGAVDRLVAGLVTAGLNAQVIEARVSDGASGVRSEIRIREGAAP